MSDEQLQAAARAYRSAPDLASGRRYHLALVRAGRAVGGTPERDDPLLGFLDGVHREDPAAVGRALQVETSPAWLVSWAAELPDEELAWLLLEGLLAEPRIPDGERVRLRERLCATHGLPPVARGRRGLLQPRTVVDRFFHRDSQWLEGGPAEVRLEVATVPAALRSALLDPAVLDRHEQPTLDVLLLLLRDPASATPQEEPPFHHRSRRGGELVRAEGEVFGQEALRDTFVLAAVLAHLVRHPRLLGTPDVVDALGAVIRPGCHADVAFHAVDTLLPRLTSLAPRLASAVIACGPGAGWKGRDHATRTLLELLPALEPALREEAEATLWTLFERGAAADEVVPRVVQGLRGGRVADDFLRRNQVRVLEAYVHTGDPVPVGRVAQLFVGRRNALPALARVFTEVCASPHGFVQDILAGKDWREASIDWA